MRKHNQILALLTTALLKTATVQAQDNWLAVRAGYNQLTDTSAIQTEGSAKIPHNFGIYGVLYINPKDKNSKGDSIPNYGELRTTYKLDNIPKLPDGFGLAGELNSGNGSPTVRFGLSYNPDFGSANHTLVKFFPIKSGDNKETQLSLFTSQDLSDRLTISALFDYNASKGPNTSYFEAELDVNLLKDINFIKNTALFLQLRSARTIDDTISYPFAGIKFDLK